VASQATLSPNEDYKLGDLGPKLTKTAGLVGLAALAVSAVLGFIKGDHYAQFQHSYLIAYIYFLSIALGGMFFTMVLHLMRGGWAGVVRRTAEILAGTIPLFAVLSLVVILPAVFGNYELYKWVSAEKVAADHLLQHKQGYLNVPFFVARMFVYFAAWIMISKKLLANSTAQDTTNDPEYTLRNERVSAPGMFVFALTVTFASFDFIMSLAPHWFSTIFGVYFFAGSMLAYFATTIVLMIWLQGKGKLTESVTIEHYHDLGKLLFAFVFFWGYICFSQYMLIWYANIPEETEWFLHRQEGDWVWVSLIVLFGHFLIPFPALLSRHVKRNKKIIGALAAYMLVMHYVDLYWQIAPSIGGHHIHLSLMDLTCWIGVGGLFVAAAAKVAGDRALIPIGDPRLGESLAFENF